MGSRIARWLVALGWAGALGASLGAAPAASPGVVVRANAFHPLDLSRLTNAFRHGTPLARQFALLPAGERAWHPVPFKLQGFLMTTGIESSREGEHYPAHTPALPVGRKARRLHLLHGALGTEKDGTPVAQVLVRYAGGAVESWRLGYGVHVRSWQRTRADRQGDVADPNSSVAWTSGDNDGFAGLRLFRTAWVNPRPDEEIASLEFISLFSRAAPFLAAVSVEEGDSGLPPNRLPPSRKIFRDLLEFPDRACRQEFVVRVSEAGAGRPLTNATASLSITDDSQSFFFGEVRADADGTCRLPYPPPHTLACHILVRAPGFVPQVFSESLTNRAAFRTEFTAALSPGTAIGGVIQDPEGKPIPGAQVLAYQVVKDGPRDYTRTEFDTATTGPDGRWSSRSLPTNFHGFSFDVTHPEFRLATFVMPGAADAPATASVVSTSVTTSSGRTTRIQRMDDGTIIESRAPRGPIAPSANRGPLNRPASFPEVSSNDLAAATARMTLHPVIQLRGTVLNPQGEPLAGLEVLLQRHSPVFDRQYTRTDAAGRFRLTSPDPVEGALIVVTEGFAPKFHSLRRELGLALLELKLEPPRVLVGRVQDRQQRPVPGARVRVTEWQDMPDLLRFEALTDTQGTFRWTGAPPDQVSFYLTKSNHYNSSHSVRASAGEITMTLNRRPGITGHVIDADTRQPIDSFSVIPGRKYSSEEELLHWDRSDGTRGRAGEYFLRIDSYYFQPEARLMIEAPGYVPQISLPMTREDSYTLDFELKPGQGIHGTVLLPDGQPAANAMLILVDRGENVSLDPPGQLRGGNSSSDIARSDSQGRFEFSPKLDVDFFYAAHEAGFAEVRADSFGTNGRVVLQTWGRIQGRLAVGEPVSRRELTLRLQNRPEHYYDPAARLTGLYLYSKIEVDDAGGFVIEKVPPGARRLALEYNFKSHNNGETPLSHGQLVTVKPGETATVTLGGAGRRVTGQVNVLGGDVSDVDWRRDVHRLTLVQPPLPMSGPDMTRTTTPAAQRKVMAEFNLKQREFWQSDAGLARASAERSYVLLFETNGAFRVDNVLPGQYTLFLNFTDPTEEYYRQRSIGQLNKTITVPEKKGARINEPFDLGKLDLRLTGQLRIGKPVPALEGKTLDGQSLKLTDYLGRHVLLFFWATYAGTGSYDLTILRELHNTYGSQGKLVVLGLNTDANLPTAVQFARSNNMPWPHLHLGEWSKTSVPGQFGVDGIPTGLLIDREGRLVARQLRGSSMRTAVRNAISAEEATVGR